MQMRWVVRSAVTLMTGLLLMGTGADRAEAHGGRFRGPGGNFKPRDPVRTPIRDGIPGMPKRPTTPLPTPLETPNAPVGTGIPRTSGDMPDVYWGTWWALNRWAYLPERGAAVRKHHVVTERDEGRRGTSGDRKRRALLARQYVKPFLLELLDGQAEKRDSVRAAAVVALAKISATEETLTRLLRTAEDTGGGPEEREIAALAVGLLRRTNPEERLDATSLDRARSRLLAMARSGSPGPRGSCYALFSLGLLADQGYASKFSEEGRMVVKGLMDLMQVRGTGPERSVAVLTALALQPRAGIPSSLFEQLRTIVAGGKVHGRRWGELERAHALSTYVRLGGPAWMPMLLRSASDRRVPAPTRRAAHLLLGSEAARMTPPERLEAVRTLLAAPRQTQDPSGVGVGQIAVGRILNAELLDGRNVILEKTKAAKKLLADAIKSPVSVRGFHVLALALAARDVTSEDQTIAKFVKSARNTMLAGFDRPRGERDLQSAYAIGLGLLREASAKDRLVKVLKDRNAGTSLRARSAIAVAALELTDEDVLGALRTIASDKSAVAPRGEAALALSILTGVPESDLLVEQLEAAPSLRQQTGAALALGMLDDPKALPAIIQVARKSKDKKGKTKDELCALAVAVLGLLGDPEDRPSLFRLSLDANYIARTNALNEAFKLL